MPARTIPVLLPMKNQIKNYDWGHPSIINEIVGLPSSGKPQAELWMGVHPGGPSEINLLGPGGSYTEDSEHWKLLSDAISTAPDAFLGTRVRAAGFDSLPFLFKLIAAHKPLSIQCHPSLQSAKEGFARENALGIKLDAANRNYKDPNHKPEIVCALTGLWALSGFREPVDIIADFRILALKTEGTVAAFCTEQANTLEASLRLGEGAVSDAFKKLTGNILTVSASENEGVVKSILAAAATLPDERFSRMVQAASYFPGDSGLLFFIVLTLYHLLPGQALFVPAGILHAYVEGLAVEVMANSDNVLRGGLTPKYIDVPELMANLNPAAHETFMTSAPGEAVHKYTALTPEFQLFRMMGDSSDGPVNFELQKSDGPEILFCAAGRAKIRVENGAPGGSEIELVQGHSLFVRPWGKSFHIELEGELYRAIVPTFV